MKRALLLMLAMVCSSAAWAQGSSSWPAKPIRIVVGFTAGGTTDIIARLVGQKLSEAWGQPVVIDNRPGAGGNIGGEIVAKSPPDGYTLLMASVGPMAINTTLYKTMPYDALKDFQPITLVADVPNLLVVPPALPVQSVADLVRMAKEKPGQLNYASTGAGTASHLAGELLKGVAGIDIVHIPFRGAVAVNDLLAGRVQFMFATIPSVIQLARAGSLRPIAVSSIRRSAALPDIPTVGEAAYPGFDASSWFGLLAPAGTPMDIVAKLHGEVVKILETPAIKAQMIDQGADPVGNTPEAFGQYLRSETEKWAKVVRASGATAE